MPDRTGIFLGWSANLSNFLGLGVEAGASPMYPQKMRVPPWAGDRHQAKHFYLAKQFCFLDADCLVVGESQGSYRRLVGKYPVKPPRPEGDSQTIGTFTIFALSAGFLLTKINIGKTGNQNPPQGSIFPILIF